MINEIYKDIKGYEGLYQISNLGNVKSIKSKKTLVQSSSVSGYKFVNLRKNSKGKNFRVHRLVAEAFIPNINNLEEINHMDGDKTNNSIYNLEWISHEDNIKHAIENGLIKKKADDKNDILKIIDKENV